MNINKVASDLTFCGSTIKSLKIDNNIVNLGLNTDNSIALSLTVDRIEEIPHSDKVELRGYLFLKLNVTAKDKQDKSLKCKMSIVLEGCFSSQMEDKECFEKMLCINGGTTLYSIARAQILNFSSNIFMNGKILLPLINMIEFMEESEHSQSEK